MMPDKTAKILEVTGGSGTAIGFITAINYYLDNSVAWLNSNYMAVIAICTIISCAVGVYGTLVRLKLAREHKRRKED